MRKTPSYLKGLAETRARAAGDAQRFKKLHEEIGEKLARAEHDLAACDRLIQRFDARLDPGLIDPIHAWQGRYGKRWALGEEIRRIIQSAWPDEITTTEIVWRVQIHFQMSFVTWREKTLAG
jgi:hypothetical protein